MIFLKGLSYLIKIRKYLGKEFFILKRKLNWYFGDKDFALIDKQDIYIFASGMKSKRLKYLTASQTDQFVFTQLQFIPVDGNHF